MDITPIARQIFVKRAHRTAKWKEHSSEIQREQLRTLLRLAADTEIGRKYNFAELAQLTDPREVYRRRVPLVEYEDIRESVMRMIDGASDVLWPGVCRDYAQSSGTSGGKSKFIPITPRSLKHAHYVGTADTMAHYLVQNPDSRIFSGKGMILGGSFANELHLTNPEVHVGDLSATLISRINPLVNIYRIPDKKIALMSDWSKKLPALVRAGLRADVTNISGVPSWFLAVIKEMLRQKGTDNLHDIWPNLEVFFHGGISFAPYREIYREFTDPAKMHFVETYNASEGFFAVQDRLDMPAMLLIIDNDQYYEFLPLDDKNQRLPHTAGDKTVGVEGLEKGRIYELVLTSSNGLWRYRLGDTVRIEDTHPVRITIAGRTKTFINAFGEELMEENATHAISEVCNMLDCSVKDYTAAPVYAGNKRRGRHQWLIEWEKEPADFSQFAKMLDDALRSVNSDYDAKRSGKYFLDAPEVITVPSGTFQKWLAKSGNHKLGGQRKVPRLSNDRVIADAILDLIHR